MGIGGHMLGSKKLKRLRDISGLTNIDRAYTRGNYTEARVLMGSRHFHVRVDKTTGEWFPIEGDVTHWTSCPNDGSEGTQLAKGRGFI